MGREKRVEGRDKKGKTKVLQIIDNIRSPKILFKRRDKKGREKSKVYHIGNNTRLIP